MFKHRKKLIIDRFMSLKFRRMFPLPMNVEPLDGDTEVRTKRASVMKVGQQRCISQQGLQLLPSGVLQKFLYSDSVLHFFDLLCRGNAHKLNMIGQAMICCKLHSASATSRDPAGSVM